MAASVQEESKNERTPKKALIALGSNIGDSPATLRAAAERIAGIPGLSVSALSSIYRSEPAYLEDQEKFANAVLIAQVEPWLTPLALLHELQAIEQEFGRVRTQPNGPRTLDLDIIDITGILSTTDELTLPHPLALERDFVVTPLLEIAPGHILADGVPVTREKVTVGRIGAA
ncbi:MAG: 2-amino-4-hydroxy-6-hydroxymethyldihydropteridine diphosphokinase [Coriobacteriales bacterium]|jgi:dihydropteroate synthase|nr:2-amino-4-hydroxy-6-hydroxymethyldihydropteridine diphosphokinase [Coriobacteriales bacterium]